MCRRPTLKLSVNVRALLQATPRGALAQRMTFAMYDTLTAFDPKVFAAGQPLVPQPSLAKSWTADSSGKVYTFVIRDGVKFANGNPLTATSIKASFERARKVAELAKRFNHPAQRIGRGKFLSRQSR